ncbi:Helix-hairpin-helix motif-containing protein [Catalinimonas alkaloidigena]|uniref:Helix-hairpin-helix motif-containing protein n=1 Tax=Catalinimonas alkaloidigena TaxID=1075417 RepID=A0A1G9JD44_9BACT|nr:helix-hairpin-helix domain-containing protein [Catalinimonas alkaloidigena]SDL35155.1 Helix-hairpin-helix motif-containing protein [Catalinimonas alkaloidigena]
MSRLVRLAVLLVALVLSQQSRAQAPPRPEVDLNQFVEQLFPLQDQDVNYEDIYEALFQYYRTPLDLNQADREALESLYILSELQINAILAHRQQFGPFLSLYELQAVPDLDLTTIRRLLPFLTVDALTGVDPRPFWERLQDPDQHYVLVRGTRTLEPRRGYTPPDTTASGEPTSRYQGPPEQVYARYRLARRGDYSFGMTVEKDPGEPYRWHPSTHQYGMDFVSYHAMLENRGRWQRIVLGDYQLQFGQGLLLSSGFVIGKGSETITTVRRPQLGIRPYTSVLEANFLRGVAATYQLHPTLHLTAFYSRKRVDGTVQSEATDSLSDPLDYVSAFNISGLHRTPTELSRRNQVLEQVAGGDLTFAKGNLRVGATGLYTHYELPLQRTPRLYNQFDFNGQRNLNVGLHYSYTWRNVSFFGEGALSQNPASATPGKGLVTGLVASLSNKVSYALLYRHYTRNFHALYGNAFGERTRNLNEQGVYTGIDIRPTRLWTISAYYDQFRFPWLAYLADAPSKGHEYLLRVAYQPNKQLLLYGQYRLENKEKNRSDNQTPVDFLTEHLRTNVILNLDFAPRESFSFKSRVQWSRYEQEGDRTTGYALMQDATWQGGRWRLSGRFALFDTDDYNNRQYAYERDVLYAFSLPAYYGRGIRRYLLVQYQLGRRTDLWFRVARTNYRDQRSISSGLEQINGTHRTDLRFQVMHQFGK